MSHAPTQRLKQRHDRIRDVLASRSLDALVVTALPNVLYLTNFGGSAALAIVTRERLIFITDFRYVAALSESRGTSYECPDLDLVVVEGAYDTTLAATLSAMSSMRVGFEAAHLTVARHEWLTKTLRGSHMPPTLVSTEGIIETARTIKDPYELELLKEGGRRLSDVARRVFDLVRRGKGEQELALEIDSTIRRAGFERSAFETIVASGPNSALPHARPTERILGEGDLVVLDFGGVYGGYCVDLTRTVALGTPDSEMVRVYGAVLEAQKAAIAAVKPGVRAGDIDAAARETLGRHQLAEAFGHSTGHGLGVEIHETPRIGPRREATGSAPAPPDVAIEPGMVFTIEPGAYLPGFGGVRIEDDVLVTETGCEILTAVPRDLRVCG
jgi:Xaa-Pro aminopeptidase